jgi:hypothetical protein
MGNKTENAKRKAADMVKYFNSLRDKKAGAVSVYSYEYCLQKTAYKFYCDESTVQEYLRRDARGSL